LNAANEVAVEAFLDRRLPFHRIADVIEETLSAATDMEPESIEDVLAIDAGARREAVRQVIIQAGSPPA
jgi:1-deoxy-D-xylulose-5-phosphate reductoisomerase